MHKLSYSPGTSLLHRLYPLTKFAWLLLTTIFAFILNRAELLAITAFFSFILLLLIKPDMSKVRGFRLALATGLILFVLYFLFDKQGKTLLDPGIEILRITSSGFNLGLLISSRFLLIIFTSYLFILTTKPNDIAYALMKIGLPYRYGFMLVTALRLAPILEEEGQTIYKAQLLRGVRYDQGSIFKILNIIKQFLTPLLISALRRTDKLVFSMEGRGFGRQTERTFHKSPIATRLDLLISLILIVYFASLLFLNYWRTL
jgi:energy-coupling factor transport system permease protein